MDNRVASKIVLLKIWEILNQETDEDNPMGSTALLARLAEIGIPCDRRTLYKYIDLLNEWGYEVECARSRNNKYWVADRKFDMPELHIMLDAVQAASFIPEGKTAELVRKIASLGGSRKGEVLKKNIVAFNTTKNTNNEIYYAVNEIVTAIRKKKQIIFYYFDYDCAHNKIYRRDHHHYKANPCATIFSEGHYYLLSYDTRYDKMSHYRIDRMEGVRILEDDIELPKDKAAMNVGRHKRQLFGMFSGATEKVTLELHESLIDVVFDVFGDEVRPKRREDGFVRFSAEVQISPIFFGWCCSFGDKLRLVGPAEIQKELGEYILSLSNSYNKEKR
ncbi:MAG: WYL domain-containing protein [Clostridia bacterium]|nr:WYL domain-containing protein [Clostridia bacterium]